MRRRAITVLTWAATAAAGIAAATAADPPPAVLTGTAAEYGDAYAAAVRRAAEADAGVVRARDAAVRDGLAAKPCADAADALDVAFAKYNDKRNEVLTQLAASDSRYRDATGEVARREAELAKATAATPGQYTDLCRQRATFAEQVRAAEDDAVKRAGIDPLRLKWEAASAGYAAARDKAVAAADGSEKVKAAAAAAVAARSAVDAVRPPKADPAAERLAADDYARPLPRFGPASGDGWWTYGWSTAPTPTPAPPAGK